MARKNAAETATRQLVIKQIRSGNGRPETHRRTLRALGLRYHQDSVVQVDNPAVRGMLFQVRHLVEVSEGEAPSQASSRAGARKRVTARADKAEEK